MPRGVQRGDGAGVGRRQCAVAFAGRHLSVCVFPVIDGACGAPRLTPGTDPSVYDIAEACMKLGFRCVLEVRHGVDLGDVVARGVAVDVAHQLLLGSSGGVRVCVVLPLHLTVSLSVVCMSWLRSVGCRCRR